MWVRIGTIDGLRYLQKHFQIVIFNQDTCFEDLGQNFQQIQMISSYLSYNDIAVDAIYGQSQQQLPMENGAQAEAPLPASKNKKAKEKDNLKNMKKPYKQPEIWEDYKQIYLDFGITNDKKIRDKVLFVNSFDSDFNAR